MGNVPSVCLLFRFASHSFFYCKLTRYPDGDPAFTRNVTDLQSFYLTDAAVADVRSKIKDNQTFPVAYYDPANYTPLDDHGTSHMAAIDQEGMAVSLTTTVSFFSGCRTFS
jgi:gamma-glutamyltranspeptidase/glutathione hydrolase